MEGVWKRADTCSDSNFVATQRRDERLTRGACQEVCGASHLLDDRAGTLDKHSENGCMDRSFVREWFENNNKEKRHMCVHLSVIGG